MRFRPGAITASALTISFGFLIILGLLLPENLEDPSEIQEISSGFAGVMLQLVTITIGLTIILGIFNLLAVHLGRIIRRGDVHRQTHQASRVYSLVLLLSFGLVIATYLLDRDTNTILLEDVQFSLESALAGLLLFALVFGAYQMMRHRVTLTGILFVLTVLVVLLGALSIDSVREIRDLRDWLMEIPVSAGARGLLLGIALATLVTGMRVLIGIDRSYRE
jgi:hypothetical protein